jgi:hypothetical protein
VRQDIETGNSSRCKSSSPLFRETSTIDPDPFPQPPAGVFEDEATARPIPPSQSSRTGATSTPSKASNLISKFGLHARVALEDEATTDSKGKGKESATAWEASSEKRELSLKERKAQMVLEARRRVFPLRPLSRPLLFCR